MNRPKSGPCATTTAAAAGKALLIGNEPRNDRENNGRVTREILKRLIDVADEFAWRFLTWIITILDYAVYSHRFWRGAVARGQVPTRELRSKKIPRNCFVFVFFPQSWDTNFRSRSVCREKCHTELFEFPASRARDLVREILWENRVFLENSMASKDNSQCIQCMYSKHGFRTHHNIVSHRIRRETSKLQCLWSCIRREKDYRVQ